MKRNIIKYIIAICLLSIIPLLPLISAKLQDERLIGHLYVETIKNDDQEIKSNQLSVGEKLEIIKNYMNKEKNIVTTSQLQDMNDENVAKIKKIINDQLVILNGLGILTELKLDDSYLCYNYLLKRYSDVDNAFKSVSVYQVNFTSESGGFNVELDVNTHKIYQYDYYSVKYKEKKESEIYIFGTKYLGLSKTETQVYFMDMIGSKSLVNVLDHE